MTKKVHLAEYVGSAALPKTARTLRNAKPACRRTRNIYMDEPGSDMAYWGSYDPSKVTCMKCLEELPRLAHQRLVS